MIKTWWADLKRFPYVDIRWFLVWTFIYIGFLITDVIMPSFWGSSLLKYAGIFLCVVYASQKNRHDYKLILALFFTFLADTILVWTNNEIAGVFVFCFAQTMHFLRLTKLQRKYLVMFTAIISCGVIYAGVRQDNILYAISALYALLLISNLVVSFRRFMEKKSDFHTRCAFYGFVAFLCCDLCVGFRHLMIDGALSATLLPLIAYLVWMFYYPSQVLLANSSTKVAKNHSIS